MMSRWVVCRAELVPISDSGVFPFIKFFEVLVDSESRSVYRVRSIGRMFSYQ